MRDLNTSGGKVRVILVVFLLYEAEVGLEIGYTPFIYYQLFMINISRNTSTTSYITMPSLLHDTRF